VDADRPIWKRLLGGGHAVVRLHGIVNTDGRLTDLRYVSGPENLVNGAVKAARKWRYLPATRDGDPIEQELTVDVRFKH
jgi:TonB family protein